MAMQRGQLGQALGMGVARNFPDPQQLVQKQMLSKAFQDFQKTSQNKNASPLDLSMSFLQSVAGIPGAERYVGQVLPLILQQAQAQRGSNIPEMAQPEPLQPQSSGVISPNIILQGAQEQFGNFPEPDVDQSGLFSGTLEPTALGLGAIPNTYSPEAIQRAKSEDLAAGFPNSPRATRMEEYNELSRQRIADITRAAQTQSDLSTRAREANQAFETVLQDYVGKDPITLALASNISQEPEFRNIANDRIRAEKVKQKVDLLGANVEQFKKSSERPSPFGYNWKRYQDNFDKLPTVIKPLIDNGLRSQVDKILSDNGWTQIEKEQIMNPLGKQNLSKISSLPNFPTMGGFPGEDKVYDQTRKKWKNEIGNLIKPGREDKKNRDVITPGTSLMLLQNEFMKKNGDWTVYNDIIQELVNERKINLDPYQQKEQNKLLKRPIENVDITEFLFGTKSR